MKKKEFRGGGRKESEEQNERLVFLYLYCRYNLLQDLHKRCTRWLISSRWENKQPFNGSKPNQKQVEVS